MVSSEMLGKDKYNIISNSKKKHLMNIAKKDIALKSRSRLRKTCRRIDGWTYRAYWIAHRGVQRTVLPSYRQCCQDDGTSSLRHFLKLSVIDRSLLPSRKNAFTSTYIWPDICLVYKSSGSYPIKLNGVLSDYLIICLLQSLHFLPQVFRALRNPSKNS